ncbi:MAG: phosphoribosylanthranilate isomerase [Pseudomonadota bacterium]|nr:phosphoribosylanthranilate isomerase [Pseudomonadota bacterium]
MSTSVKICGVNSPEALSAALHAGADMVGFVFYEPSPRFIGLDTARQFARHCRDRAEVVALVVDAADNTLEAILKRVGPDYFQLHGQESPERVAEIQEKYGVSVIKAIGVADAADLARSDAYDAADALLIDAKPPKGALLPGGNGVPFDWGLVRDFSPRKPWLLSGGLTAENVGEAIRASGARAVDVSSGVESAPGVKNPLRIAAFIAAARAAFAALEQE